MVTTQELRRLAGIPKFVGQRRLSGQISDVTPKDFGDSSGERPLVATTSVAYVLAIAAAAASWLRWRSQI